MTLGGVSESDFVGKLSFRKVYAAVYRSVWQLKLRARKCGARIQAAAGIRRARIEFRGCARCVWFPWEQFPPGPWWWQLWRGTRRRRIVIIALDGTLLKTSFLLHVRRTASTPNYDYLFSAMPPQFGSHSPATCQVGWGDGRATHNACNFLIANGQTSAPKNPPTLFNRRECDRARISKNPLKKKKKYVFE